MNRFTLRASKVDDDDEEDRLYERQALIYDDDNDICDDEINNGQVVRRHRSGQTDSNGFELKSMNHRPYRDSNTDTSPVEFTYYDIQTGDSLQSICLRYACSVNQVKRLNGLMTDQDFYGLRRLKLPLGKLGLLEELLNQQNGPQDLLMPVSEEQGGINQMIKPRLVNSPGSALSVASRHNHPRFRPLLSPGYSSDRINEMNRYSQASHQPHGQANGHSSVLHNSHSFSSLRELANGDTSNNTESFHNNPSNYIEQHNFKTPIPAGNFIKSDIVPDPSQVTIDNMLIDDPPVAANVFEDLDFHVERAKAAAENYDQRAAELVSDINLTNNSQSPIGYTGPRQSRIPELFFSGENFGLNLKRLILLIFFLCLVIPLLYMSQANVIK